MEPRHDPQGALRQSDGSVLWRVWAPATREVRLVTWPGGRRQETVMEAQQFGYHVCRQEQVDEGLRYAYWLAEGCEYPDPASRWQPEGVHKPSAVFFPEAFAWTDQTWRGIARRELVVYELHVGTFTREGTLDAIVPRLAELAELGVTALELMPLAQFPGERNWGYDGVHPYAVQSSYGGPRALQRLVDAAHRAGLAVLLDVVYNHLGPEGNYFGQFGPYFTDHYHTPWGQAINFDGPDSDPVRQFFIDNARMWVRDFHIDGLRLDATHAIYDFSARHILSEVAEAMHAVGAEQNRLVHVIAETHQNDVRLVTPEKEGGCGLDGIWSDDFHHAVHALLTGERDGYYLDFGAPEQLAKAIGDVFVYDGCYSPFRRRRHGNRVGGNRPEPLRGGDPESRSGGQPRSRRSALDDCLARGQSPGLRAAAAFAVRAAVVHGRGIRRHASVSLLLLVRQREVERSGPPRPAGGIRRVGVSVEAGDSRPARSCYVHRRKVTMVVARWLAPRADAPIV